MGWQSTFTSPSMVFVDASVWFAATVKPDADNERAKALLERIPTPITTDHVLLETWMLLKSRYNPDTADRFWGAIRGSGVKVETVTPVDLGRAYAVAEAAV